MNQLDPAGATPMPCGHRPPHVWRADRASSALLGDLNRLLPLLSPTAAPLTLATLERLVQDQGGALFVVRAEGEVTGTVCLALSHCLSGTRAFLEDLVVATASRRRGIAEALVRAALDYAWQQGARSVDLTCRPHRLAANRLYGKLGFQQRATNYYRLERP